MFCVGIWREGKRCSNAKTRFDYEHSVFIVLWFSQSTLFPSLSFSMHCRVFSVWVVLTGKKLLLSVLAAFLHLHLPLTVCLSLSLLLSLHSTDHPSKCARWIMRKIAQIIAGIISEKNTPKAWNYSNWRKMCCRIMYNTYECLFSFAVHSFLVHFSWAVARHFAHFRYACFPTSLFSFRISNRRTIFEIGERCSFRKIGANSSRYFLVGKTFWTRKDGKWFIAEKYAKN